jgi:hypothetical protein
MYNNAKEDEVDVHLSSKFPLASTLGKRRAGTLASTSAAVCRRRGKVEQQVQNKPIHHHDWHPKGM